MAKYYLKSGKFSRVLNAGGVLQACIIAMKDLNSSGKLVDSGLDTKIIVSEKGFKDYHDPDDPDQCLVDTPSIIKKIS